MALEILPPSPNWYLTSASSCSEDGVLAFATKSSVFLLDVTATPPTFAGNLSGHTERVTSVAFCRATGEGSTRLCATAGDDGFIKIWDTKAKSVCFEKKCQENKITSLDWSKANDEIVVAGDEKGCLIYWDIKKDDVKLLRPDKGCIYSLVCSPHDSRLVALGYKDGKILIVDALSKKAPIVQHLRGHNDEVQSVTWAPFLGEEAFLKNKQDDEDVDQPVQPGCLLVSGSRDKTIRMWSTGQGKLLKVMNLPPRGGGGQRPRDRGDEGVMKSRVWVSLYWPQDRPTQLISSSHGGDVIVWDLSKPSTPRWEILGGDTTHQRSVFNISGRQGDLERIITTSMDRQVICWNLSTLQSEWCLPTMGGFVYSISPSPLDPARLAIGVGDQMIRVWNTGARGRVYDVITLWQGIKSKVTVVCWHPTRENSLAYGTDDGRVGIFNVSVHNKPPQQFWTYHKKTIYSLSWGPPCPKPDGSHSQSHHIYSCGGEGLVYQHNPAKLEQESTNINTLIKQTNNYQHLLPSRSDVAWRLDGRAVAIGNEDGSIEILAAPDLRHLCTIHVQRKIINCLSWYPNFDDDVQSEPLKFESHQSEVQDSVDSKPLAEVTEQESAEGTPNEGQDEGHSGHTIDATEDASLSKENGVSQQTGNSLSKETGVHFSEEISVGASKQTGTSVSEQTGDSLSEETGAGLSEQTDARLSEKTAVAVSEQTGTISSEQTGVVSSEKTDVNAERSQSEQRFWLASGSNDYEVEIYDLSNVLGEKGEPLTVPMTSSYRTLTGHTGRVTSLTWSPHSDGRLVSTSYDNSAQIWDVLKGEPVANFRSHMGRVFSSVWSCSDPDIIMTGGEDFCLFKWQGSKVNHVKPPKSSRKPFKRGGKKGKKPSQPQSHNNHDGCTNGDVFKATASSVDVKEKSREVSMATINNEIELAPSISQSGPLRGAEGNQEIDDAKLLLERKKRELLAQVEEIEGRIEREKGSTSAGEVDQSTTDEQPVAESDQQETSFRERSNALAAILDRLAPPPKEEERDTGTEKAVFKDMTIPGVKKGRKKKFKSLFPTSGSQDQRGKAFLQQDCIDLTKLKQGLDQSSDEALQLGLFVDRKMTLKMINDEAYHHGESGNSDQKYQLQLWKGNILQPLREAIKKGQLTEWMVAMAPLAGHDVWLQTCNAYAKQLESHDQIHRAVSFYLLSHQVYKAIDLLKKSSMFKDAITLAQLRLLPSDPVLDNLYLTWANQLESNNSYEPAARCYLAVNQPMNAIKLLARKGDVSALGTALHVAILSDCTEDGLVVSIATRFLNLSLLTGQWKQAVDIFFLDKKYKVHTALVLIYELLVWCLIQGGRLQPVHDICYTSTHTEITPNIEWKEPKDDGCVWSNPTLNGGPLVQAMLATAGVSCDQTPDLQSLLGVMPYDLTSDINKVLRFAAEQILLGQRSGQSEVKMGHVAEAVKLCHASGHPAVAIGVLQVTMPQDEVLPSSEAVPMCLKVQCRLTQLYHIRTRLQAAYEQQEQNKETQSVQDGRNGMPSKEKDDSQVAVNASKDDDDDGVLMNPRTEGHLFQSDVLKETSWPLIHHQESQDKDHQAMPLDSSKIQNLSQEELVDKILDLMIGTHVPPSLVTNGEHETHVNGVVCERSCSEERYEGGNGLTSASQTMNDSSMEVIERATKEEKSSEDSHDYPDRTAEQHAQPGEQCKYEPDGSQPNNGKPLECPISAGAFQKPLGKDLALITSMKNAMLQEHYNVVSNIFMLLTRNQNVCTKDRTIKEPANSRTSEEHDMLNKESECVQEAGKEPGQNCKVKDSRTAEEHDRESGHVEAEKEP